MLEVERVDFASVPTRDAGAARRYGEVLGLRPNPATPDEFETANLTLALWEPEREGRGVEFLGETVDTGVCLMAFFHDPDGNVLILHRRYAVAPV